MPRGRGNPFPPDHPAMWSRCRNCQCLAHWGECQPHEDEIAMQEIDDPSFIKWLAGVLRSREFQSELVAERLENIAANLEQHRIPVDQGRIERLVRELAEKLYHHAVTKYDPAAVERCIQQTVAALTNKGANP